MCKRFSVAGIESPSKEVREAAGTTPARPVGHMHQVIFIWNCIKQGLCATSNVYVDWTIWSCEVQNRGKHWIFRTACPRQAFLNEWHGIQVSFSDLPGMCSHFICRIAQYLESSDAVLWEKKGRMRLCCCRQLWDYANVRGCMPSWCLTDTGQGKGSPLDRPKCSLPWVPLSPSVNSMCVCWSFPCVGHYYAEKNLVSD